MLRFESNGHTTLQDEQSMDFPYSLPSLALRFCYSTPFILLGTSMSLKGDKATNIYAGNCICRLP